MARSLQTPRSLGLREKRALDGSGGVAKRAKGSGHVLPRLLSWRLLNRGTQLKMVLVDVSGGWGVAHARYLRHHHVVADAEACGPT